MKLQYFNTIRDMKTIYYQITALFTRIKIWHESRIIKSCIKEADYRKIINHKQQFVIRLNDNKFVVVTSKYVDAFNSLYCQKGKATAKKMTYSDLC